MMLKSLIVTSAVLFAVPATGQQDDFAALQRGLYPAIRYCINDRVDEPLCDVIIAYTPKTPLFYRQHAPYEGGLSIEEKKAVIRNVAARLRAQ